MASEAGMSLDSAWQHVKKSEDIACAVDTATAPKQRHEVGLWIDDHKLGSVGIHVARHHFPDMATHQLTSHGVSINILNDVLPWFEQIAVCGVRGRKIGSFQQILGDHGATVDSELFQRCRAHFINELGKPGALSVANTVPADVHIEFVRPVSPQPDSIEHDAESAAIEKEIRDTISNHEKNAK